MSTNRSKFSLGYHIIWCPKYRHQVLKDAVEVELKQVLAETCAHYEWTLISLEIMPDHVHLFVQANPQTAPVEIAKTLKSISAVYLFNKFPKLKKRKFWGSGLWSRGTYYASVGHITEESVRKYIETQKTRN
jgi:putative transposase